MAWIHLDQLAGGPPGPGVWEAMVAVRDQVANPASLHRLGRGARRCLRTAAQQLLLALGLPPDWEVVWTASGAEADSLALGQVWQPSGFEDGEASPHAVPWLREPAVGGAAALDKLLQEGLADGRPLHVIGAGAVGWAGLAATSSHIETGPLTPWLTALPGLRSVSIDGPRAGGPPGSGALLLAPGHSKSLKPLWRGGEQQPGRSGTVQVAPAVGLGAAAHLLWRPEVVAKVRHLRDKLAKRLTVCADIRQVEATSGTTPLPQVLTVTLAPTLLEAVAKSRRETAKMGDDGAAAGMGDAAVRQGLADWLERAQVAASIVVLQPMATAQLGLRFSLGHSTTADDVAGAAQRLLESLR